MGPAFAFCLIAATGWGSPDVAQPISTSRENSVVPPSRPQRSYPQNTGRRPAVATKEGAGRQQTMPFPPTDPRAYAGGDLPQPPTMNESGTVPNPGPGAMGPRPTAMGQVESVRRLPGQKAFGHYKPASAVSPWQNLYTQNTGNGTVNPYYSTIRPAEEQRRANNESDRGPSGPENAADQPAPAYPRAFANYGAYYPDYSAHP